MEAEGKGKPECHIFGIIDRPNTETPVKVNEPLLVQADPWPWTN